MSKQILKINFMPMNCEPQIKLIYSLNLPKLRKKSFIRTIKQIESTFLNLPTKHKSAEMDLQVSSGKCSKSRLFQSYKKPSRK